jgi:hypothetical protein
MHEVQRQLRRQIQRGLLRRVKNNLICKHTGNEGPVGIQYKCLVPDYVFPETKLHGLVISEKKIIMFFVPISTYMYL